MKENQFLGVGIKFPVGVNPMTGAIETVYYEEDIQEAIGMILMTRKGERIMRPEFGSNIHKFAFAVMDYTNCQLLKSEVMEALAMWEPRIKDVEVEIIRDAEEDEKWNIDIRYHVRMTNNPYNLVFPYYVNEGMAEENG